MSNQEQAVLEKVWFYEENGFRKGPVTEAEMIDLISAKKLTYGSSIWRSGMDDWFSIEQTDLRTHLEKVAPPPLTGNQVNNSLAWTLAFAPLIGMFLEGLIAGAVHGNNSAALQVAQDQSKYWFITLALNIALSVLDEKRLVAAGIDTSKFKNWFWLVPVYLFQRAKALKQNLACFIVWMVCFVFSVLI